MTDSPLTLARLRADIADMVQLSPDALSDDANLMDMGLDSMRAMNLAMKWEEDSVPLDFTDLAEAPTIADLWALLRARQEGA